MFNSVFRYCPQNLVFGSDLEFSYREFILKENKDSILRLAIIGTVMYMLFTVIDFKLTPERILLFFNMRVIAMGGFSLFGMWFIYKEYFFHNTKLTEAMLIIVILTGQLGHIVFAWAHDESILYYAIASAILFSWGNSFLLINFRKKVMMAVLNLLVIICLIHFWGIADTSAIFLSIATAVFLPLLSLIITYGLDVDARRNYIKLKLLTQQYNDFKEIEQFTAHEFKTSIRVINSLSHLVLKNDAHNLSPKSLEYLIIMKNQILTLNDTINEVRSKVGTYEMNNRMIQEAGIKLKSVGKDYSTERALQTVKKAALVKK